MARYVRHAADRFLDRAGSFLEGDEAQNCLLLGIGASLAEGDMTLPEPPILATVEDGGRVVLAAICTPPHNLMLSTGEVSAVRALCDGLERDGVDLPGVTGPAAGAEAFAEAWAGSERELTMRQGVYSSAKVIPPAHPGGALRVARKADHERLVAWTLAFNAEAGNAGSDAGARRIVAEVTRQRRMFVWENDGEPVAVAAARQPTPHGIRVGYVYTPPERRRRGYASAVTAGATQAMLDEGYARCFLFTDLANPTSNAIYQRIGYVRRGESAMWRFNR